MVDPAQSSGFTYPRQLGFLFLIVLASIGVPVEFVSDTVLSLDLLLFCNGDVLRAQWVKEDLVVDIFVYLLQYLFV